MTDADRIKELEAKLAEAKRERQRWEDSAGVWERSYHREAARVEALEKALERIKAASDWLHADGAASRKRGEDSKWSVTDELDDAIEEGAALARKEGP